MTHNPPNLVQVIADQLASFQKEREDYVRNIEAIDAKIASIAEQLGIEVPSPTSGLPRLPRPVASDKRHRGSLPEAMVNLLLHADRGYTRTELKAALRDSTVGDTIKKNENTYYNAVKRYLAAGKIVEVDGCLYHPDRAPLPDGEEDPTGQHLPANVSSLFGPQRRAINLDD